MKIPSYGTHDLQFAAEADEILHLEEGALLERGTHADLLRHGGRYASLYRLQATATDENAIDLLPAPEASEIETPA